MPSSHSCHPAMGSPGQHFSTEMWSNGRVGAKMQSFCKEVLSSPLSPSTGGLLGTHVPLQFLNGNIPLVPILGMPATAQLQAVTDTGSIPAPLALSASDTPAPQPDIKWWCHSYNQGMPNPGLDEEEAPDDTPEEPSPTKSRSKWLKLSKRPDKRPSLKTLKWWGWPIRPTVKPTRWSLSKKGCIT